MTVDVDDASHTLYVHFLFLHDVEASRAGLERLEGPIWSAIRIRDLSGSAPC